MNENPKWKVARLDDFERRGSFIPVREFLGIHSFGINARVPGEDGTLVNEHDESGSGQEEVYVVLDGSATFEVDGETFDAPAGTFVSVAAGSEPQGDRRRNRSRHGRHTRRGVPGPRLGRGVAGAKRVDGRVRRAALRRRARDRAPGPRALPGQSRPQLQLRVFRVTRGRGRRRDVQPPPAVDRVVSSRSASRREGTTISPPSATTRGSRRRSARQA